MKIENIFLNQMALWNFPNFPFPNPQFKHNLKKSRSKRPTVFHQIKFIGKFYHISKHLVIIGSELIKPTGNREKLEIEKKEEKECEFYYDDSLRSVWSKRKRMCTTKGNSKDPRHSPNEVYKNKPSPLWLNSIYSTDYNWISHNHLVSELQQYPHPVHTLLSSHV